MRFLGRRQFAQNLIYQISLAAQAGRVAVTTALTSAPRNGSLTKVAYPSGNESCLSFWRVFSLAATVWGTFMQPHKRRQYVAAAFALTSIAWLVVQSPCQAQEVRESYWTVWKPSDKRALDLIEQGYELKSAFAEGKAEFGYLQKGASIFRCVLSQ
ncbi:MAG: hypothetical protein ACREFB_02560, partial [Stellaceae bacterium]